MCQADRNGLVGEDQADMGEDGLDDFHTIPISRAPSQPDILLAVMLFRHLVLLNTMTVNNNSSLIQDLILDEDTNQACVTEI